MTQPTRRAVAKGAAWSIPAVAVAGAAPAMAASPCSQIIAGQPLPASAFTAGYFIVTNQTFGILNDKVIVTAAGIALTSAAATCVGSVGIRFAFNTTNGGTLRLTNGRSYAITGGAGVAGSGTAGVTNRGCSGPAGATGQACNTYVGIDVNNSSGTSSANPSSATLNYLITVDGYGTTTVTMNVASFVKDGTNWDGVGVSFS